MRPLPEAARPLLSAALLAAAAASPAHADQKPLWEFGLGAGMFVFNDYRGSDTTHAYPVPVPYFIYRGEIFKSDQEGLRGRFFSQDRIELNLSINGTTPVRNDSARQGMPDLRPTLEIGGSLNVHLSRSNDQRFKLDLRLPARAALTVEASPRLIGGFFEPHVALDVAQVPGAEGWKLGMLAGPLFADRRYNGYFYNVAPQYATAGRPAYEAPGGYAGTQTLALPHASLPGLLVRVFRAARYARRRELRLKSTGEDEQLLVGGIWRHLDHPPVLPERGERRLTPSKTHLVLIPSYNPGDRGVETVRAAREQWAPVWVVVDGSTDGSVQSFSALAQSDPQVRVLLRSRNGGKGAALFDGLLEAQRAGFTHALTMDSDGQHPAQCIPQFMAASARLPAGDDPRCSGVRRHGTEDQGTGSQDLQLGANLETLYAGIQDSLFGFRVYPIAPLVAVMRQTRWMRRFDFDAEAVVRLSWRGIPHSQSAGAGALLRARRGRRIHTSTTGATTCC